MIEVNAPNRIPLWIVALALMVLVLLVGSMVIGAGPFILPWTVEPSGTWEGIGELAGASRVCQTFVAEYDNLSYIQVRLDNYDRENRGPFTFSLRTDPDASQDLVVLTHDMSQVESRSYHAFLFSPLRDSAGQAYCFCLEAPEAGLKNSITAWGRLQDTYPQGKAVFDGMWGERAGVRDLDFNLGYNLSLWNKLLLLLEHLVAYKPFPLGSIWFYALLAVGYVALVLLSARHLFLSK